jgi:hypothetical protein
MTGHPAGFVSCSASNFAGSALSPFLVYVVPPVAASVDVLLLYQESKGRASAPIAQGSQGVASRRSACKGLIMQGSAGRARPRHTRPQGS